MIFESQIKHYQDYTDRYLAFRIEFRKEIPYSSPFMFVSSSAREAAAAFEAFGRAISQLKKVIACILIFTITAHGQTLFQDDKFLHHQTSALLSGTGSIISFKLWEAPVRNVTFSVGTTVAIGAGKEVWDGMGHGHMDWKGDFPMDIVGSVTGGFFAGMAIRIKYYREEKIDEEYFNMNSIPYNESKKAVITYETTVQPN